MATLNYRFEVNKALNRIIVERIKSTYCNDSLTKNWIIWQHITNHCYTVSFFLLQFGYCVIKHRANRIWLGRMSIVFLFHCIILYCLFQNCYNICWIVFISIWFNSCIVVAGCVSCFIFFFFACCSDKFFARICCSLGNRTVQIFQAHTAQPQISMDLLWFLVMAFLAFWLFGFCLSNTSILTFFPRIQSILMARFQNHTILWHMTNNGLRQRHFFRVDLGGSWRTKIA